MTQRTGGIEFLPLSLQPPYTRAFATPLPAGWRALRLKYVLDGVEQGWSPECEDRPKEADGWGVLKAGCANGGVFRSEQHKALPAGILPDPSLEIRPGDVLMSRANTRQLLGAVALVQETPGRLLLCDKLYRLRLKGGVADPRFMARLLGSSPVHYQLERDATGASDSMQNTSQRAVNGLLLVLPGLDEQRAIADFLDRETERIDALVAKKQRLIELLQEKRTALISHAVTKGLDPDAPMKDSGIKWLGQIPQHWEAGAVRRAARIESGHTPSRQHPEYWEDCTVPWFTLADIWQVRGGTQEYVCDTAECVSGLGLAHSSARLLPVGTVLLSRTASVGFSAIAGRPMATSQDFANWVCGPRLAPEYLLYVFRSMSGELMRRTMGSTHKTIYMPDIAKLAGPLPPTDEQRSIVEYIRREITVTDRLSAVAERTIERLTEYRSALITAAATGQVDVRADGLGF